MQQKFQVTGMTCSACVSHVEKAVGKLNGVDDVKVSLMTNSMQVAYQDSLTEHDIIQAVVAAGYGASSFGNTPTATPGSNLQEETRSTKKRIVWSLVFLLPLFYLSIGHMFSWPLPNIFLGHENALIFGFTLFLLTLPILYLNRSYYQKGFAALRNGAPTMDTLIALGSAAAVVYGIFALYQIGFGFGHNDPARVDLYRMDLYFESAGMLLTLITVGKYLESRSKAHTTDAIEQLMQLAPQTVAIERDGVEVQIPAEALQVNDIFLVRPGERIPADGVIVEGSSYIDQSTLTGESLPILLTQGNEVMSASYNQNGFLKCRATKVGADTTLAQIISLVEEASASKAPIARLADRISAVFVPVVISISIVATITWLLLGYPFSFALSIGIAVLVISCPCALGLATPVAIMAGTGKGAENGILIRNGEALERAHHIDTVLLDKTGTLTIGKPQVVEIIPHQTSEIHLLSIATALEQGSEHPLGRAIVQYAETKQLSLPSIADFIATEGMGVQATIDGKLAVGGNLAFLHKHNINPTALIAQGEAMAALGRTPLYFAYDGEPLGLICVADTLKSSAVDGIEALKSLGIDVIMLTGDHLTTAQAIANEAHITHVIAQVLPQEKTQICRELQEKGRKVAMVGDGINDTPALAQADIGIAMNTGSDIALNSADIILMSHDLCDIANAIRLSKATIRNIKQNLFWAFFYNSIGIPLAAGVFYTVLGWKLNPMFATAAMSFSSLTVITNALRLQRFQKPFRHQEDDKTNPVESLQELDSTDNTTQKEGCMMEKKMMIDGMMCTRCSGHVEKALNAIDGVEAKVDLEGKCAYITLNKDVADDVLIQAVTDAEYTVVDLT